jgi:ABC-2 type transport system ATP-binding protein
MAFVPTTTSAQSPSVATDRGPSTSSGQALAIRCRGLVKRFPPDVTAVDGLDLEVARGECFGLLGPNGAGKTTTVEILEGILAPTAGEVEVLGRRWDRDAADLRERLGITLQETHLPEKLTVEEIVRLFRALYRHGREVDDAIALVGLEEKRGAWYEKLSGGQKQRLAVACALVGDPELLFLDEPTTGLDPQSRRRLWDVVAALKAQGKTVLLTTHYMDEAEHCDRIAIMDSGRIVALDTPEALKAGVGKDRVRITTADDEAAIAALRGRFGVEAGMHSGEVTFAVADGERFVPRLFAELGVSIRSVSVASPSLDDVFLTHTGSTIRDAESSTADRIPAMFRAGRR